MREIFRARTIVMAAILGCAVRYSGQAPPTLAQALTARGILLDATSLHNALLNRDPAIRSLAAGVLAERQDHSSIPAIQSALNNSSSGTERINMAQALLTLGDSSGIQAMIRLCRDLNVDEEIRILAAERVLDHQTPDCVPSLIAILATTSIRSHVLDCLDLLKRQAAPTSGVDQELERGLNKALSDKSPMVRSSSSELIRRWNIKDMTASLAQAIGVEQDPKIKAQMEADLDSVKKPT